MKKGKASADYCAGYAEGRAKGIHDACVIFCAVLKDKWNCSDEDLRKINGQIEDKAEAVGMGFVSVKDLEKALNKESGVYFATEA